MKIRLENVSAGYDKKNLIIKDFSTTFEEGGICGILGPNGSGKTTLLRILSGIIPYSGKIELQSGSTSIELSTLPQKKLARYIAVTPQFSSVYFSYTVYETILMGRYAHADSFFDSIRGTTAKDKELTEKAMEMTGLGDLKDKQINELSGGQLQRVMLARTFAQETPILLLDEPTNHLDIKYHSELIEYLAKWAEGTTAVDDIEHKNTVISVFHDIGDSALISDSILLMKNGQLIKKGPAQEILTRDLLSDVFDTDVIDYYKTISDQFIY